MGVWSVCLPTFQAQLLLPWQILTWVTMELRGMRQVVVDESQLQLTWWHLSRLQPQHVSELTPAPLRLPCT
jgi:hypothetical protein